MSEAARVERVLTALLLDWQQAGRERWLAYFEGRFMGGVDRLDTPNSYGRTFACYYAPWNEQTSRASEASTMAAGMEWLEEQFKQGRLE